MAASYMHCNNHIFWHADLTRTYMPPKKTRAAARRFGVRNGLEEKEVRRIDSGHLGKAEEQRDARSPSNTPDARTPPHSMSKTLMTPTLPPNVSQVQVLKFLLSQSASPLILPPNEPTSTQSLRTYSDLLTSFEELLCAVIISRPIPHRDALRIIRTMLNAPYNFHNAVAIKTAGPRKLRQALADTMDGGMDGETDTLFDALCNNDWHNDISRLRLHARNPIASQREPLRRSIAGLAPGGLDIFFRRVQWQWVEIYPFVDVATRDALGSLGLPTRAQGLDRMIEVRWQELGGSEGDGEEERRKVFVICCERARGVVGQGRMGEVIEAAQRMER